MWRRSSPTDIIANVTVIKTVPLAQVRHSSKKVRRVKAVDDATRQRLVDESATKELDVVEFRRRTVVNYTIALMLFFWGLAFWSVPLWRAFCESDQTSFQEALTGIRNHDTSKVTAMEPDYDYPMVLRFSAT